MCVRLKPDLRFVRPDWAIGVARQLVDSQLVVWTDSVCVALSEPSSAIARFFDGLTTIEELAEDLSAVTDLDMDDARQVVGDLALELFDIGAVHWTHSSPSTDAAHEIRHASEEPTHTKSDAELATSMISAPTLPKHDAAAMASETVEHLPDGRRRVTASITFESNANDLGTLLTQLSPAEMAPVNSCVGTRLRLGDPAYFVSARCSDGHIRSIRVDTSELADSIWALAPEQVDGETNASGPVVAFATKPLSGFGRPRVYDSFGQRRGRPTNSDEVARLVSQLLSEHAALARRLESSAPLLLDAALLISPQGPVLAPLALLEDRAWRHHLLQCGFDLTWTRAQLYCDTTLRVGSELDGNQIVRSGPFRLIHPTGHRVAASDVLKLFKHIGTSDEQTMQQILARIAAFHSQLTLLPPGDL